MRIATLVLAAVTTACWADVPRISPVPQHAAFETRQRIDVGATRIVVRCDDAAAGGWDMGLGPDDYKEFGFTANQFDRQMPAKY